MNKQDDLIDLTMAELGITDIVQNLSAEEQRKEDMLLSGEVVFGSNFVNTLVKTNRKQRMLILSIMYNTTNKDELSNIVFKDINKS